jgi:hypothetical protein
MAKPSLATERRSAAVANAGKRRSPEREQQMAQRAARAARSALAEPGQASPTAILQLQRTAGNRAVQRLLAQHALQPKLVVGAANDQYEQEAERVANQVMGGGLSGAAAAAGPDGLQRQPQAPAITPLVQRHVRSTNKNEVEMDTEDELRVQRQPQAASGAAFEAGQALEGTLNRRQGAGNALDQGLRGQMEARFGADFSGVRVHTDGEAAQLNRSLSANAFTRGQDVYFAAGKYQPGTHSGQHLLTHELTHVVQQTGGQVRRQVIQRDNVPRGATLPDLNRTTNARVQELVGHGRTQDPKLLAKVRQYGLNLLHNTLTSQSILKGLIESAMGQQSAEALDGTIKDLRAAFTEGLKGAADTDDAFRAAARYIDQNYQNPRRGDLINVAFKVRATTGSLDTQATAYFSAKRGQAKMDVAYLDDQQRAAFATALKQLSIVAYLMNPTATGNSGGGNNLRPEWKDAGALSAKVQVKHSKGIPDWLSKRRANKQLAKFTAKIDRVDAMMRAIIEPEILARVRRPDIYMHTRGAMGIVGSARNFVFLPDPTGYRASAGDGNVNLAYNEAYETMAHEMGHAIEDFLPMKSWHDMNLLLEKRHREKMGNNRQARTGATMWTSGKVNFGPLTNEGRYAGRYVTGKYTSTAYDDNGNAEVFSQAMEFFAKPKDGLKLIEGDPQHAAIVLRSIRPKEYKALQVLRPFDKYLPYK